MNKKQKGSIIISAIASIGVAGSILVGGTYALFTSESTANIAVTSGNVNLKATASNLWVYSPTSISMEDGNEIIDGYNAATQLVTGVKGQFYNGGTATLDADNGLVTLDKMTPGDKVTFTITLNNYSNVKIKYRTVIKKVDPTDDYLYSALNFNIGGLAPDYYSAWQTLDIPENEGDSIKTYNCSVELPTTVSGAEYMNKKCTIAFSVEAVQSNAITSDDEASSQVAKTIDSSTDEEIMDGDSKDDSTVYAYVPANSTSATSLTLIKTPTEVPGNISIDSANSAVSTDVKIVDQDGNKVVAKNDKFFTIMVDVGKDLEILKFYHNTIELTNVASLEALTEKDLYYYDVSTGKVTFTTTDFSVFTAEIKFAGGLGAEDAPYLIETADHFSAINDEDISKYTYYKVADGVTDIDLTGLGGIGTVDFFGSFDGNGVTFKAKSCVFRYCGYATKDSSGHLVFTDKELIFKNFTVDFERSAYPVVVEIDSKLATFENVDVHGTIMSSSYHLGIFYQYGPGNYNSTDGIDYTVNFKNCSSDATLISTSLSYCSALVGHTFPGSGHTATINIDKATDEGINGTQLFAMPNNSGNVTGYKYYIMGSTKVYLDGVEVSSSTNTFTIGKIALQNPTKGTDSAAVVETVSGASTIKVQLATQLSAYDDDGNAIANRVGITNNVGKAKVFTASGSTSLSIFDKFSSVEIVNQLTDENYPIYNLADEKLTITTNDTINYITGTVTLYVTQFAEDGTLLATGSLLLAKRSTVTDSWTII